MTICSVGGCDRPSKTRDMCGMHAERVRSGVPLDLPLRTRHAGAVCLIDSCDRKSKTRGLCGMHAERVRNGLPLDQPPRARYADQSFDSLIVVVLDGCHEWRGAKQSEGYGVYRGQYAHRISFELHTGPIPEGHQIDHLCRNRACVNPQHLEAVPPRVNVLRSYSLGAIAVRTNQCGRGHEYTPENTYVRPDGKGRQCRECNRICWRRRNGAAA